MLLLSSLLGPAKPPVASHEDVASAGGVYRVRRHLSGIVAVEIQGARTLEIESETRCLICLCDYEDDDRLRQLNKCNHLYHQECIDEVCLAGSV